MVKKKLISGHQISKLAANAVLIYPTNQFLNIMQVVFISANKTTKNMY